MVNKTKIQMVDGLEDALQQINEETVTLRNDLGTKAPKDVATPTSDGLMSSLDKENLDSMWDYRELGITNYPIVLQNGVLEYSADHKPLYRKVGKFVEVMGAVKDITNIETVIGTLPEGYRPPRTIVMPQITSTTGGNARFARWAIRPNGEILMDRTIDGQTEVNSITFWHFHFLFINEPVIWG